MDTVLRALAVYAVVFLIFRLSGKRNLGEISAFDLVLMIIIAEAVSQALHGEDLSITGATILVATLVSIDIALSLLELRSDRLQRLLNGVPVVVLEDGKPFPELLAKERLDETDILSAARRLHGLERLDDIKYAILERDGGISVVPRRD